MEPLDQVKEDVKQNKFTLIIVIKSQNDIVEQIQYPLKIHIFKHKHPRMLEIPMPGHARREERVEAQRRRNREQMNFFCRYVLAKQGKTIPYN